MHVFMSLQEGILSTPSKSPMANKSFIQANDEESENDMYHDINKQSSLNNDKSQSLPNITDDVFFDENHSNNNQRQSNK